LLSKTYALMIASEPIAAQALNRLHLDRSPATVVEHTTTEAAQDTQLLYIRVQDQNPVVSQRLANALGVEELPNEPHRVEPRRLAEAGLEVQGELWAMMLDPKRTFDELIERVAPDAERAEEIKANRVYRELSSAVSGSQEFTAVAKLYDLDQEHEFDLLVLDLSLITI